ncbi:hypothetical protein NM1476_2181 [Neisseria meningitidis NM1476]|nr:hypothetical protein NM1476_2181 [Neisseria meningitidis NM1476]
MVLPQIRSCCAAIRMMNGNINIGSAVQTNSAGICSYGGQDTV